MKDLREGARLDALRQLNLLDTPPSEAFDRVTRMASQIFDLPIAAVSLTDIDRQWFKSRVGVDHTSIPREKAPCAQCAENTEMLVIPDLLADPYYRDSHLARSGIRFYAGAPLVTNDGFGLGAMCVLGTEPREASVNELTSLNDLAAIVMAQIELQHAFGRVDPMSGMPNRNQFLEDIDDLARDRTHGERLIAVLIDLASPEQLNNAVRVAGPSYLDDMVHEAARAIRAEIGPERRAYNVAPTQFVFLAPFGADEQDYIASLPEAVSDIRGSSNSRFVTTTAIGVVPFKLGEVSPRDVLRYSNSAAQDARASGKEVSVYSSEQDRAYGRRFTILNDFGASLESAGQLKLAYQPRIDLKSGLCVGAEALLRWRHPDLGDISPAEFIPLVEQTAMARAMTAWVLDAALDQLAQWRKSGLDLMLSVNVSAANLRESDLAHRIRQAVVEHALPADRLELEITESAVMEDAGKALAQLEAIAAIGVSLAIDDFGTGYSSLSYLQRLPVHVVKIDRAFMGDLTTDERKHSLVGTMISLTHDLGYRVVAEGVETSEVRDLLAKDGCDEAQGYFFGRPMAPQDFADWAKPWVEPRAPLKVA